MISYFSLLDMSSAETLAHGPEILFTKKFIAAVTAIEKDGKQPECPKTDKWLNIDTCYGTAIQWNTVEPVTKCQGSRRANKKRAPRYRVK